MITRKERLPHGFLSFSASVLGVVMFRIQNSGLYKITNGLTIYKSVCISIYYTRNDSENFRFGRIISIGKMSSISFVKSDALYAGSSAELSNVKLYKDSNDVYIQIVSTSTGGSLTLLSPFGAESSSIDPSTLTEVSLA